MNQHQYIKNITQTYADALAIVSSKVKDYATKRDPFTNFRSGELIGVSVEKAILIQVLNKVSRIHNLLNKEASNESITDSCLDAINYLAILKAKIDADKDIS